MSLSGGVKEVANFVKDSADRLREIANKGEGVQNPKYFAKVINRCPYRGKLFCLVSRSRC